MSVNKLDLFNGGENGNTKKKDSRGKRSGGKSNNREGGSFANFREGAGTSVESECSAAKNSWLVHSIVLGAPLLELLFWLWLLGLFLPIFFRG